jgi:hypothetical protein
MLDAISSQMLQNYQISKFSLLRPQKMFDVFLWTMILFTKKFEMN